MQNLWIKAESQNNNKEQLLFKLINQKYTRRTNTDIAVTLNTYTSVFDKFKENEIDKVNRYYMNENLISNNNLNYIDDSINDNTEELENR